jgi:hypothetical protein
VKDVRLDLDTVRAFCDAYQHIRKATEFDFTLQGAICRSENINGKQMFLFPDDINPKFRAVLDAMGRFEKEIASVELNGKEVRLFIAELFEQQAYAAGAQGVLQDMKSAFQVLDERATMALATLLETKMQEAIDSVEVTITAEMLEEKRVKWMPNQDPRLNNKSPSTGKPLMQNRTLSLSKAVAICRAQHRMWEIGGFEFRLGGQGCAYLYVDGLETYSPPDEVRLDLEALIEATRTFEHQILQMKPDQHEVSRFLSKYFRMNARTVAERRILRILESQWKRDDTAETALFSFVLEDEVRRVMSDLAIEVTEEMLQAKLKDINKEIS